MDTEGDYHIQLSNRLGAFVIEGPDPKWVWLGQGGPRA